MDRPAIDVSPTAAAVDAHITTEKATSNGNDMPATILSMPTTTGSPFMLRVEDVECLIESDGFTILRDHLSQHCNYELCKQHIPASNEDAARWHITRDILHALLVPVVELFDKATSVAENATHASKIEDLEYAYTGEARGAFLWLQCFLDKERAWTYTQGCPACVVSHALDSEFTIRLLYAACLLSDVHYPFTLDGPTLPSFIFFLDSLHYALENDPLYGDGFFELTAPKAMQSRDGIEDLIHQCLELDALLSAPSTPGNEGVPSAATSANVSPVLAPVGTAPGTPGMKVKRSKMARRQMRLKVEEEQWMEEMLRRCALQAKVAETQSLDAAAKQGPVVAVDELVPGD